MATPKFQRRKDDRPAEITEAALASFAENGYAGTRVDDVAKRAGVSKGLLYLYFKTKEELFRAVIKSFIAPKIAELSASVADSDLSAEAFIRGPFQGMVKTLPNSPVRVVLRLLIAEGHKHPDLVAYYWENVVSPAIEMMRTLVAKGVRSGEFRSTAVNDYPQLLVSPVMLSLVWNVLFAKIETIDSDEIIETHLDAMLEYMAVRTAGGEE